MMVKSMMVTSLGWPGLSDRGAETPNHVGGEKSLASIQVVSSGCGRREL